MQALGNSNQSLLKIVIERNICEISLVTFHTSSIATPSDGVCNTVKYKLINITHKTNGGGSKLQKTKSISQIHIIHRVSK